jgi:hypothetical protein
MRSVAHTPLFRRVPLTSTIINPIRKGRKRHSLQERICGSFPTGYSCYLKEFNSIDSNIILEMSYFSDRIPNKT